LTIKKGEAMDRKKTVSQALEIFNGLSLQEADDVFQEVRFHIADGHSKANLEKLFNSQIARLRNRSINENIIEKLRFKRKAVINKAQALCLPFNHIPFIPVITERYINLSLLLRSVFFEGVMGFFQLSNLRLSNIVAMPEPPYYIFDVEDGKGLLNVGPRSAEITIKGQKRSCLTYCETVALAVHTDVLTRHNLMAIGSRCSNGIEEQFPDLYLRKGKPTLDCRNLNYAPAKEWGTPSCSLLRF
jgi:hypothetical protein